MGWPAGCWTLCTQEAGSWELWSFSRRAGFLSGPGVMGVGGLCYRDCQEVGVGQEKQLKRSLSLWARGVAQDH